MAAYRRVYDSRHLQADCKNRDQLRNPTLGNRVWAAFIYPSIGDSRRRHRCGMNGNTRHTRACVYVYTSSAFLWLRRVTVDTGIVEIDRETSRTPPSTPERTIRLYTQSLVEGFFTIRGTIHVTSMSCRRWTRATAVSAEILQLFLDSF